MYGYGYGPTTTGGGIGFVGFLLFAVFGALVVAGVALLILWVVRGGRGLGGMHEMHQMPGMRPAMHGDSDPALKIARERFARGEIDAEQLEAIKKHLGY
jgi:uncharacterized membrane protein